MILVATLGTGQYQETNYYLSDKGERVCRTCYGPVATADLIGGVGEAILLLTPEAESRHWDRVCRELESRGIVARKLAVPAGRTAAETWQVVRLLNDAIPAGPELVIDITHALRHLPVLMLASLAYLTAERGIRIRGIYYGAFEAREGDRTPVFDLMPFVGLIDAYHALRQFRETGDARRLAGCLREINAALWKQAMGSREISDLANCLRKVSARMAAALPLEAGIHAAGALAGLERALANLPPTSGVADSLVGALVPMLERIAVKGAPADKKDVRLTLSELERQLEVIRFCLEFQAYEGALLLLREWVVSRCLLAENMTDSWLDYNQSRRPMEAALNSIRERIKADACAVPEAQHRLAEIWDGIAGRRNMLAHAGMCSEDVEPEAMEHKIRDLLGRCAERCADDTHWRVGRAAGGGDLLVTPLGLSPGVLYTALMRTRPERVLVLTSTEGARRIAEICERAQYPESQIDVEIVNDAHGCFEIPRESLARVRPRVMAARCVVVNVTGGTTALQYLAERIGRDAERLGVPVRRIALVDRRPYEQQQAEPFACGDLMALEE
jgi:CRISPR-associated DxTHG motif protein